MGGSPALVVVAGCSFPRGCEFESQQRVLDRYFFTFLSYKLYCCSLKKTEVGNGPFYKTEPKCESA